MKSNDDNDNDNSCIMESKNRLETMHCHIVCVQRRRVFGLCNAISLSRKIVRSRAGHGEKNKRDLFRFNKEIAVTTVFFETSDKLGSILIN